MKIYPNYAKYIFLPLALIEQIRQDMFCYSFTNDNLIFFWGEGALEYTWLNQLVVGGGMINGNETFVFLNKA